MEDEPENRFIIDVLEKFEAADIEIVTKDLTTDINVPVVAAFSRDLVYRQMVPIDGFGAHLDPRVALVRALLEIATTRALFLQKYGLNGLCETAPLYLQGEGYEDDPRFYAHEQKNLRELERGYSDDILEDVRTMIARLSASGLDCVIAVDLQREDIGMPTVRMIVPGLETYCFDQTRTGKRAEQSLTGS
jgi:YcaO-like protein with predicted kinase domain